MSSIQKQQPQTLSADQTQLTKSSTLNTGVILKEQQDTREAIKYIANLLDRIAVLYQIPNWTAMNAVVLAEWTFDNYKWDSLETIELALKNPTPDEEKTYRLTPDSVSRWIREYQERSADQREQDHHKMKLAEKTVQPSEGYIDFYRKNFFEFSGNIHNQPEVTKDQALENFRTVHANKQILENPKKELTEKDKEFNERNKI